MAGTTDGGKKGSESGELMKEKTTIVIAHRLSKLVKMNGLLVFAEGKIIEQGDQNTSGERNYIR